VWIGVKRVKGEWLGNKIGNRVAGQQVGVAATPRGPLKGNEYLADLGQNQPQIWNVLLLAQDHRNGYDVFSFRVF
jgi:hypothetical protein